ncbi:MAG: cation:proton antiporter [Planctomycetota bacterium]|nr:cation:proton antiporter [Planctomycetota bacterium]
MFTLFLLSSEGQSPLLRDLVVILAAAAVVATVLQRLRLATIPAYLITGAIIGPGALAFVNDPDSVRAISDLAIVLLLFGVGLHMDLSVLSRGLRQMALTTVLMTVLCTALLWPFALLLGERPAGALVVAMAVTISSTVVVLRVLLQRRELNHPEGRLTFGVLIIQDLAAVVMLMILPPLARWAGTGGKGPLDQPGHSTGQLIWNLTANGALAVAGITGIILVGRYVLPRLLTEAARGKSSEVLVVLTTAAALGAASLTQGLLNNAAIGAFLAGFLLSATPFRHQLSGQVGALRDVFSAVFFTAIGMTLSLDVIASSWITILLGTVIMMTVKTAATAFSVWATGGTGNVAIRAGAAMSQSGEFSLLLLSAAAAPAIALVSADTVGVTVAITVLSLILTPPVIQASAVLGARLKRIPPAPWARQAAARDEQPIAPDARAEHVRHAIIAGFGLVGRAVADELKRLGVTYTVVDLNPATFRTQTRLGRQIVFGDVSNPDVLETAGVAHAELLVLTIPDEESVLRACKIARELKPDIFIIARTNFVSQGVVAAGMGADGVVVEEMATAREMEIVVKKVLDMRLSDTTRQRAMS